MPSYLVTGATSGLGLELARQLVREQDTTLIVPVRDAGRGETLRQALLDTGAARVATPMLDLASLTSVAHFLEGRDDLPRLDGVALNAGVQSATRLTFTDDGYERTFAVNHLAHHLLLEGLLDHLKPSAIVVWTASGTHDPKEAAARLSGYRGAQYTGVSRMAAGDYGASSSTAQTCRDAYATSKLCNIVSARLYAHRHPQRAMFHAFDPGLMPGTGLARDFPRAAQWAWHKVLPRLAALLPGTSTPTRSARVLAAILTGELRGSANGAYFNYTAKEREAASPAAESWVEEDLGAGSDALLREFRRAQG